MFSDVSVDILTALSISYKRDFQCCTDVVFIWQGK